MGTSSATRLSEPLSLKRLAKVKQENIVYADESGMDSRDGYDYGYSPKGDRLYDMKSGNREGRVNMIAALCNNQLLAPFTIEGVMQSSCL